MVEHESLNIAQPMPSGDRDIFASLTLEQKTEIESHIRYMVYPAGRIIHTPHDKKHQLFLLKSGRVQIYTLSPEERILRLFVLEPVTIFGEITNNEQWNNFAKAMTRCLIGTIERDIARSIFQTYPPVALRFMEVMGKRLREMENKLVDMAFKSVPQRLANVFLNLAISSNTAPDTPPSITRYTHQQLAEMIGTYRETVTKTIGEFREAGLIRVEEDGIYLTNLEKLRQLVQQ